MMHTYYHHKDISLYDIFRIITNYYRNNRSIDNTDIIKSKYFSKLKSDKIAFVGSARMALYCLLSQICIADKKCEVILSPYNCNSVVQAIRYSQLTPIFVDCDLTGSGFHLESLKKRINKNTSCIISANIYGLRYRHDRIYDLCKEHNIPLIQDCAHSYLPKEASEEFYNEADYKIFSFGPTKPISGRHGSLICSNKQIDINRLSQSFCKAEYNWGNRAVLSYLCGILEENLQKFGFDQLLLRKYFRSKKWWAYHIGDYETKMPLNYPVALSYGEFSLIEKAMKAYDQLYEQSKRNTLQWYSLLKDRIPINNIDYPLLGVPVKVNNRNNVIQKLSRFLETPDWFFSYPYGSSLDVASTSLFPHAEHLSNNFIILPTHAQLPKRQFWFERIAQIINQVG